MLPTATADHTEGDNDDDDHHRGSHDRHQSSEKPCDSKAEEARVKNNDNEGKRDGGRTEPPRRSQEKANPYVHVFLLAKMKLMKELSPILRSRTCDSRPQKEWGVFSISLPCCVPMLSRERIFSQLAPHAFLRSEVFRRFISGGESIQAANDCLSDRRGAPRASGILIRPEQPTASYSLPLLRFLAIWIRTIRKAKDCSDSSAREEFYIGSGQDRRRLIAPPILMQRQERRDPCLYPSHSGSSYGTGLGYLRKPSVRKPAGKRYPFQEPSKMLRRFPCGE